MRSERMLTILLLWSAFSAVKPATIESAGQEILPKGQLIDTVVCRARQDQGYALYLPSHYDPGRRWPVLYCFDPGARGKVPVELFREAAERYGYILAGSNNSRNGPNGQNTESMIAMTDDTRERLSIDPARCFAAGMSGGARVACGFALGGAPFAGVVAFAAGFPGAQTPGKIPFFLFGAAGTDDFNYPELRRLDGELEKVGATKRIVTFEGEHGWPPASICTQAIEWLELQSMKAGARERDPELIEALFEKAAAAIRAAEASHNPGESYLLTKSASEDFRGLRDVSALAARAAQMADSREVRRYLQDERDQEETQNRRQWELLARWNQRFDGEAVPSFAALMSELKRQSEARADSPVRRIARRTLQGTYIHAHEQSRVLAERKDFSAAVQMLQLAASIHPERQQVHFNLAAIYARAKDRKNALSALKKAASLGFHDVAAIERDRSFDFLRADPAFTKLLGGMK